MAVNLVATVRIIVVGCTMLKHPVYSLAPQTLCGHNPVNLWEIYGMHAHIRYGGLSYTGVFENVTTLVN